MMTTDDLLTELRHSPTDLARLVQQVVRKKPSFIVVSADAVNGWRRRDPRAWTLVCNWLSDQGVTIRLI